MFVGAENALRAAFDGFVDTKAPPKEAIGYRCEEESGIQGPGRSPPGPTLRWPFEILMASECYFKLCMAAVNH